MRQRNWGSKAQARFSRWSRSIQDENYFHEVVSEQILSGLNPITEAPKTRVKHRSKKLVKSTPYA